MVFLSPVLLVGLLVALALPGAPAGEHRTLRLLRGMVVSGGAVVVPLVLFAASGLFLPDWKGACPCGWWDGFHTGKYALTPVVLFATLALYRLEVLRRVDRFAVLGVSCGAGVAVACAAFGVLCIPNFWEFRVAGSAVWLVAAWYLWRAVQLAPRWLTAGDWLRAVLGLAPFAVASRLWSNHVYQSLPDKPPPNCFVVTAAMRGHPALVGPFFVVTHGGVRRGANRQLCALWQFEAGWHGRFPRGHARFRSVYDRVGPLLAARIRSPWVADLVFLALKPVEWLARLATAAFKR